MPLRSFTLCVKSALMGYEIVELKREIARLESENSRLEYTIAELSSLERVQAEAEKSWGCSNLAGKHGGVAL